MNGSVFILNETGLYCSNDADIMTEQNVVRDDAGKIVSSKREQVIRVMNFLKIEGNFVKDDNVYCQFKFDDNNSVESFSASISGITEEMIILNLKARTLHNKEILNTIKNKIKEN